MATLSKEEKLKLSSDLEYGRAFPQGLFMRLYGHSLYWFSRHVKELKAMIEPVKGGQPVLYGGLPVKSFNLLVENGTLRQVEVNDSEARWAFAGQPAGADEDFEGFALWCEEGLKAKPGPGQPSTDVLAELKTFDLARATPLEAMLAISRWQSALAN